MEEREFRTKYAMKVMGCRTSTYWLGTFFFDFLIILTVIVIWTVALVILDLQVVTDNLMYFFPSILGYGVSIITGGYMWGYLLFKSSQSAYKSYGVFCLAMLYYIPLFIGLYAQIKDIRGLEYSVKAFGYIFGPFLLF